MGASSVLGVSTPRPQHAHRSDAPPCSPELPLLGAGIVSPSNSGPLSPGPGPHKTFSDLPVIGTVVPDHETCPNFSQSGMLFAINA